MVILSESDTPKAEMESKIPLQITRFAQESNLSHEPYYENSYLSTRVREGQDVAEKNGLVTVGSEEERTTYERGTLVLGGWEKRGTESVGFREGTGTELASGSQSADEGEIEGKSTEEEGYTEEEVWGGKRTTGKREEEGDEDSDGERAVEKREEDKDEESDGERAVEKREEDKDEESDGERAVEKIEEEEEEKDEGSDGERAVEKREEEGGKEEKMGAGLFPEDGEEPKCLEVESRGEESEGERAQKKTPPKRRRGRRHRRHAKPERSAEKNADTPRGTVTKGPSWWQTFMTPKSFAILIPLCLVGHAMCGPVPSNGTADNLTCIACTVPGCVRNLTTIWYLDNVIWNNTMEMLNCTEREPSVPCQHDGRVFIHRPSSLHRVDMEGVAYDSEQCPSVGVRELPANTSSPPAYTANPTSPATTTGTDNWPYWILGTGVTVLGLIGLICLIIYCLKRRKQDNGDAVTMVGVMNQNSDTMNREGRALVMADGEAAADDMTPSNSLLHGATEHGG